jgi:hypothetical protein
VWSFSVSRLMAVAKMGALQLRPIRVVFCDGDCYDPSVVVVVICDLHRSEFMHRSNFVNFFLRAGVDVANASDISAIFLRHTKV